MLSPVARHRRPPSVASRALSSRGAAPSSSSAHRFHAKSGDFFTGSLALAMVAARRSSSRGGCSREIQSRWCCWWRPGRGLLGGVVGSTRGHGKNGYFARNLALLRCALLRLPHPLSTASTASTRTSSCHRPSCSVIRCSSGSLDLSPGAPPKPQFELEFLAVSSSSQGKLMNCGGTCIAEIVDGKELLIERKAIENRYLMKYFQQTMIDFFRCGLERLTEVHMIKKSI